MLVEAINARLGGDARRLEFDREPLAHLPHREEAELRDKEPPNLDVRPEIGSPTDVLRQHALDEGDALFARRRIRGSRRHAAAAFIASPIVKRSSTITPSLRPRVTATL